MRTEEQLKRPLFTQIFGDGAFGVAEHGNREYYCASREDWTRVLGSAPNVRDAQNG